MGDDTALAYAYWLEEHDDPRGAFLRAATRRGTREQANPHRRFAPDSVARSRQADAARQASRFGVLQGRAEAHAPRAAGVFDHSEKVPFQETPDWIQRIRRAAHAPRNSDWPMRGDEPLAFLVQFNLRRCPPASRAANCPDCSSSFFSVYDDMDWGKLGREGAARVDHFPEMSKLTRHAPPYIEFNPCRPSFTETITMPYSDSPWKKELAGTT